MTSSQHGSYVLGYTHATMGWYKGKQDREVEQISKSQFVSSDSRLQLACLKSELLVTVGQHTTVNMFPGLVHTARHVMEAGNT